jgi:peptide/nickel transport system substrate-binding protein
MGSAALRSSGYLTCAPVFPIVAGNENRNTRVIKAINRRDFLRQTSLAGLALAGSAPGVSWAVQGDQLHIRNYTDITSLDPPNSVSGAEGMIEEAIYQGLLQFRSDGSWDLAPDAAETFEKIDDTHYAFRLKPDQQFSNGFGEMTADDVKFSLERAIDPALNALNAPDLGPFSHVEVHDRYSGMLVLKSPYAAFESVGLAGMTGAILSRKAMESVGGRFTVNPPSCSGPYLFREWRAQRKTILDRNPSWKGPEAAFSEVHIYPMYDKKAGEMAFEAGQIDCAWISVESVEPFRKNPPPDSQLEVYPSGRNAWIGMNAENPALSDIRVRQAIQYAIDVDAVLQAGWFGLSEPSTGPVPAGMVGHRDQSMIPTRGNREKARALLREAGVKLPLHLRLDTANGAHNLAVAQVVQWSLKKVGIEVDIIMQDNNSFLDLGQESKGDQWRDVQLFYQSFIGGADPYYSLVWFTTQQVGLWNWERFSNPEFDQLNDLALATTDTDERERMYRRMQDLMEASGCYRFISNDVMPQLFRNTIKPTFKPDGNTLLRGFRPAGTVT